MIVEDEELIRQGLTSLVDYEQFGMTVINQAENGREAWEKFQDQPADILLTDINMPQMNGLDLAHLVKEQSPSCHIIFLTGYDDFEFARKAIKLGADDYLLKPLQKDKLFRCLTDILKLIPNTQKYLTFSNGNIEIQLLYSNILYLRASNHNTLVMTADGTEYRPYIYYKKLAETLSGDERFLQVSRGILCNMDHITGFSKNSCFMTGDVSVPITIRNARQLEQAWRNYEFMQIHRLTDKKES